LFKQIKEGEENRKINYLFKFAGAASIWQVSTGALGYKKPSR